MPPIGYSLRNNAKEIAHGHPIISAGVGRHRVADHDPHREQHVQHGEQRVERAPERALESYLKVLESRERLAIAAPVRHR